MTELEYKILEGFEIKRKVNWGVIVVLIALAAFWTAIGLLLT